MNVNATPAGPEAGQLPRADPSLLGASLRQSFVLQGIAVADGELAMVARTLIRLAPPAGRPATDSRP